MKKMKLALSAIALSVLLAGSAFAAESYETDSNGAFDVSYSGKAGEYYAVVVLSGIAEEGSSPVITEEAIQYVDQKTAGADGKVSFEDILLKVDGTPSTVYLGGSDLDSAVLLGYVNNKADEFTVSGKVTSASASSAKVALISTTDTTKSFTVDTKNGSYTFTVPADTYKFTVTKSKHLSYTKNALEVADDVTKDVTLKGGDVTGEGAITYLDFGELLSVYNTVSDANDINEDGVVNYLDFGVMLANYNAIAVVE